MSRFETLGVETTVADDIREIKDELSKLKVIESLSARILQMRVNWPTFQRP